MLFIACNTIILPYSISIATELYTGSYALYKTVVYNAGMLDFSHVKARIEKPITKATSQRSAEIEPFVKRLNNSRIAGGYKPYPVSLIAKYMSHIETEDLPAFYKKLDSSKNFCALWHYFCKPKKKSTV